MNIETKNEWMRKEREKLKRIGKSVWVVGSEIALCNYDMNKD